MALTTKADSVTVRLHHTGQAVFKAILPEQIEWKPFAAFPPSVGPAFVVDQPFEDGPYTIRVKVSHDVKLMPHRHPEDRTYRVISSIFYMGLSDQFDAGKLVAYPPGAVMILAGNTSHFHWAKSGEYITEVTAIGPRGLENINSKDNPRNETPHETNRKEELYEYRTKTHSIRLAKQQPPMQ